MKRETVYIDEGPHPMNILLGMFPPEQYRLVVTKDGKPPKRKKVKKK